MRTTAYFPFLCTRNILFFTDTLAKHTVMESSLTLTSCSLPADNQINLLMAAIIFLGIALLLKMITTAVLFYITARQQKSITILLGHPYVRTSKRLGA